MRITRGRPVMSQRPKWAWIPVSALSRWSVSRMDPYVGCSSNSTAAVAGL
jgi:hypothetical protein